MATTSITHYNRIEPRPRYNDLRGSLAAEIRDPLWFLTRQWQMGEFQGEDAGSVAYVRYNTKSTSLRDWQKDGTAVAHSIACSAPLEPQTLNESFRPDLSVAVELSQLFADSLSELVTDSSSVSLIVGNFRSAGYALTSPVAGPFDPIDAATQRFLLVCGDQSLDGVALYQLAVRIAAGRDTLPAVISSEPTVIIAIQSALSALIAYVQGVYGTLSDLSQPETWQPSRLEYKLQVNVTTPSGDGLATLDGYPDRDGEYQWFSFDVASLKKLTVDTPPKEQSFTVPPIRIRFPGMPNPRFWTFEEGNLGFVDVSADKADLIKLIVTDFMLIHGDDWYVLPHQMPVGTLTKIDGIIVKDVFGVQTYVGRADREITAPGLNRWTMFSIADCSGTTESLSDYFILPQSSGEAIQHGAVLEDVRFVRDEMANMAWAVERITPSRIGEPRRGAERDAQIDQELAVPAISGTTDFPLRYHIETHVPANWIPLLPVQPVTDNPSIVLQKGAIVRPVPTSVSGTIIYQNETIPALGAILNPAELVTPYQIAEEELPRSGTTVQRVISRTRWIDGSTHFWVQRRRRTGAGEAQSNLNFDQALSND